MGPGCQTPCDGLGKDAKVVVITRSPSAVPPEQVPLSACAPLPHLHPRPTPAPIRRSRRQHRTRSRPPAHVNAHRVRRSDGTIIFATTNATTGLQRIAAAGGEPTVLTRPNRAAGEADHSGRRFCLADRQCCSRLRQRRTGLTKRRWPCSMFDRHANRADSRRQRRTVRIKRPSSLRGGRDTARGAFDLATLAVVGSSVAVLPGVQTTATGAANVALAANGTLVYVPGGMATGPRSSMVWVDREGHETAVAAPVRSYVYPRVSPDGTRLALFISDQELDIWLWNLVRPTPTRLSSDAGLENYPVWAADGRHIYFSSEQAGGRNLFAQAADGTGGVTRLSVSPKTHYATSVSPDGAVLIFTELGDDASAGDVLPAPTGS